MRILTNNIHPGWDVELAATGHEFDALSTPFGWRDEIRPRPANWRIVDRPEGRYDVALCTSYEAFDLMKDAACPMVYAVIADCSEGDFPPNIEERCESIVFLAREVADRWRLADPWKRRVVEMGTDLSAYAERTGHGPPESLTVGHRIAERWDKGFAQLREILRFRKCAVAGPGNGQFGEAWIGVPDHAELVRLYSAAKAYLNPGPILGISVVEAMAAGMPMVTFRPINMSDLIVDGVNGFVTDTVDGALLALHDLSVRPKLREQMGRAARRTAAERFSRDAFCRRWDGVLSAAASARAPENAEARK